MSSPSSSAPGTGPAGDERASRLLTGIRETPLSVDEVLDAVRDPHAGAVALFVGMVRDHDHGQDVTHLTYSSHPSAVSVAHDLATGFLDSGQVLRIAVVHRVGDLAIGDLAIVAGASSAHRHEAFAACRDLVDAYKGTVPIWKHQVFADGTDEWVGLP